MGKQSTSLLLGLGLAAVGSAVVAQESVPEIRPRLRVSVAVLPFFVTPLQDSPQAEAKADGYAAAAQAPEAAGGPAELLAEAVSGSEAAAAVVAGKDPRQLAPLQLQGVFTRFEHTLVPATDETAERWEAVVELSLELSDTRTGARVWNGVYEGRAPAHGAASLATRRAVLRRGLRRYTATPLGKAFSAALDQASLGSAAGERALLPLLKSIAWEARVTSRTGGAFTIDAGSANGLRKGDLLTPLQTEAPPEGAEPGSPRYHSVPGLLRVTEVAPSHAVVTEVPDEPLLPEQRKDVTAVYFGRVPSAFDKALVDTINLPKAFARTLDDCLKNFEASTDGAWGPDSIVVTDEVLERVGKKIKARVRFETSDRRPITEWVGTISEDDAAAFAKICFREVAPTLRKMAGLGEAPPLTDQPDADPTVQVEGPAPPSSFLNELRYQIRHISQRSQGHWPAGTLRALVRTQKTDKGLQASVQFLDSRSPVIKPIAGASWSEVVTELTAIRKSNECVQEVRQALVDAGSGGPKGLGGGVTLASRTNGNTDVLGALTQNRRQGLRLRFEFAPDVVLPKGVAFREGETIKFRLRADSEMWVMAYSFGPSGNVTPMWKVQEPKHLMKGGCLDFSPKVLAGRPTGQEYVIAIGWTQEAGARDLIQRQAGTLTRLHDAVTTIAYDKGFIPKDLEPVEADVPAAGLLIDAVKVQAARLVNGENGLYAVAWLQLRTAPAEPVRK
ncbi:MAG: hypothetical protein K0Q72_3125 [Armatimonadetes bacterium]|jgi:hypothetical protein|nr:hypothetical protein [Armatimonadota bacterium]